MVLIVYANHTALVQQPNTYHEKYGLRESVGECVRRVCTSC